MHSTLKKHSAYSGRDGLVIGLDCSTSGTKAIAFHRNGSIAAEAHKAIPLSSPHPGAFEQDPEDWWRAACMVVRKITRQVGAPNIVAIAISNQRETFVPLDRDGRSLRPAILWLDERCKDEVVPFSNRIGRERIHRITGKPVDYAPVVYRLAWMKKHEPSLFKRIAMICDVHAYLVRRLTGSLRTSWASADPLGLFDLKHKRWSPVVLDALRLDERTLPQVIRPGTALGRLTGAACDSTGLAAHTLVIAGGGDGQCAGLGANVLSSERAYLNLGTAVVAGVYGKVYRISNAFRTMGGWGDNGYYYESSLRAGTFAIDWFIDSVLRVARSSRTETYMGLEEEARNVPAGCGGLMYLPYLCGAMNPYWDMSARGAFVGLTSAHHRGHMYRAILEGIAFEQAIAFLAVEKVSGVRIREVVVMGGGAASTVWRSILADVTGKCLCLPGSTEASALGAAIAAAVGAGWYRTFRAAGAGMTSIRDRVFPDSQTHKTYRAMLPRYQRIYPALYG
jgi:sugar (pentulose or hexulose) kinase